MTMTMAAPSPAQTAASAAADREDASDETSHAVAAASSEAQVEVKAENNPEADVEADAGDETLVNLSIILPDGKTCQVVASLQEQASDIRQSVMEFPAAYRFTCFHFEHEGRKVHDFLPLSETQGLGAKPELHLVPDPYTEREARIHLIRMRELLGSGGDKIVGSQGALPGLSLYEYLPFRPAAASDGTEKPIVVNDFDFESTPSLISLYPESVPTPPKTIKSLALSSWHPPTALWRHRGHLLYLVVTTNEGEQLQITSHVSGFFVNKSSNAKFDPCPRQAPKGHSAHSLLELISLISPSFSDSFSQLNHHNGSRDPLATFAMSNAIPACPWFVPGPSSALCAHLPDPARPQELLLFAGVEHLDSLRDWNEELQTARELPKSSVQDRVFRERLLSKLLADYNAAAINGAVMIVRGDVPPLNSTEELDAQIFVYNNIFFSFGVDGVGTFTSEGGDEAAHVASSKDVDGVRLVNQFDIDGLSVPATVVIDYMGRRVVAQSIVPGIFKQREPGDHQVEYGAAENKNVIAADERFAPAFARLSKALRVKKHPVWDKDGKKFDLEASLETKGLMGTDGRKYVLDLYRITPLDIAWLDDFKGATGGRDAESYPHRMTVLRPELVESFARFKLKQWMDEELARRAQSQAGDSATNGVNGGSNGNTNGQENRKENGQGSASNEDDDASKKDTIDASGFHFPLNPDVFTGQVPESDEDKAQLKEDEKDVREACGYLRDQVIPDLLRELLASEASFPMDGQSLSRLIHKRGINVRYLGMLATLAVADPRLSCLRHVCIQDMVARAFKHIACSHLRRNPVPMTSACISHLLNCLLGRRVNPKPHAELDPSLRELYQDANLSYERTTPESLQASIVKQVQRRFRYKLDADWENDIRHMQLLREVCLKLGIQIRAADYAFQPATSSSAQSPHQAQGHGQVNGETKKKKKKKTNGDKSPLPDSPSAAPLMFHPEDIIGMVPIMKHSSPRSLLAEEALEAGRLSLMQNQRKIGTELLLESLSLYEQIYGVIHSEVAKVYSTLSMLYFQMGDKEAAAELSRKAIIVVERTIGIDSSDALLNYLNLSLFLHSMGDSRGALETSKHVLTLWMIIYGPNHPDSITTVNNAAVMLQHLREYHESRRWFEEALRVCESVFGKQSVNVATLLFQLAQALALDHESKEAVKRMREAYNIFLTELGPENQNTKEAETWLEQLTQNAVSIAKHAKDAETRRPRTNIRLPLATAAATTTSSSQAVGAPPMDSRSIDELIKFIEGGDNKGKSANKGLGRGNPKRRGKSSAA